MKTNPQKIQMPFFIKIGITADLTSIREVAALFSPHG